MEALLESPTAEREVDLVEVYAKLIAMAAVGIEEAVGASATGGLANLAARELYNRYHPETSDVAEALNWLNENTVFRLETYRVGESLVRDEGERGKAFYLIARECPVRQILYLEDLPYGRTLCRVLCAYLERLFADKLGGRYRVALERAGPNACLLRAAILRGPEPPGDMEVKSRPPSLEEYRAKLLEALSAFLHATADALYMTLGGNVAMSYRAGKEYGRLVGAQIMAEGYDAETPEEAVELMNRGLRGLLRARLEASDTLILEWSRFDEIIEREGLKHPDFIKRLVQGFMAGILETLLGKRLDLRSTTRPNTFKLVMNHA